MIVGIRPERGVRLGLDRAAAGDHPPRRSVAGDRKAARAGGAPRDHAAGVLAKDPERCRAGRGSWTLRRRRSSGDSPAPDYQNRSRRVVCSVPTRRKADAIWRAAAGDRQGCGTRPDSHTGCAWAARQPGLPRRQGDGGAAFGLRNYLAAHLRGYPTGFRGRPHRCRQTDPTGFRGRPHRCDRNDGTGNPTGPHRFPVGSRHPTGGVRVDARGGGRTKPKPLAFIFRIQKPLDPNQKTPPVGRWGSPSGSRRRCSETRPGSIGCARRR